jgi:hypothetical protein
MMSIKSGGKSRAGLNKLKMEDIFDVCYIVRKMEWEPMDVEETKEQMILNLQREIQERQRLRAMEIDRSHKTQNQHAVGSAPWQPFSSPEMFWLHSSHSTR